MWKYITGYKFPYRVNQDGCVQKFQNNKWVSLSHIYTSGRMIVKLVKEDGTRVGYGVLRLLDKCFNDDYAKKHGLCVCPKNGVKSECTLSNITYKLPSEVSVASMLRHRRRPVIRYDRFGNSEVYKSVTEAAKKNWLSKSSLDQRIYHGVLDPRGYRFELCTKNLKEK